MLTGNAFSVTSSCKRSLFFFILQAWWCSSTILTVKIFKKFKYPKWRLPPSLKREKSPYLSDSLTDLREIWHGDAYWQLDSYLLYRQLKIWPSKNPAWCTGDVWTIEKSRYVGKGLTNRDNLTVTQPQLIGAAVKITNPNRQPTLTILVQNQNPFVAGLRSTVFVVSILPPVTTMISDCVVYINSD